MFYRGGVIMSKIIIYIALIAVAVSAGCVVVTA